MAGGERPAGGAGGFTPPPPSHSQTFCLTCSLLCSRISSTCSLLSLQITRHSFIFFTDEHLVLNLHDKEPPHRSVSPANLSACGVSCLTSSEYLIISTETRRSELVLNPPVPSTPHLCSCSTFTSCLTWLPHTEPHFLFQRPITRFLVLKSLLHFITTSGCV